MKSIKYTSLFIILLALNACKKDTPKSKPVVFTSTTYETLGTYDATGRPNYLVVPGDSVSAALLAFISKTLPEHKDLRKTNPGLLTTTTIGDIKITQHSDVYITFVSQGGDLTNSVAFYTYPTTQPPAAAKDIQTITYIFPNSGHLTPLHPGDKVKIGSFEAGTSIGFVLLQSAWDINSKTLNHDVVHFCSNDVLNPEIDPALKKHAVLIDYAPENKVLIGFEDTDRTTPQCDQDFNDVVVYATVVH